MSQEISRTQNRILGPLSRLENFLMNPLVQGYSGTAPLLTKQRTNEDDSHVDLHPETGIFNNQTTQNSGSEAGHDSLQPNPCCLQSPFLFWCILFTLIRTAHSILSFNLIIISETEKLICSNFSVANHIHSFT